jgi:putative oxidoreductase
MSGAIALAHLPHGFFMNWSGAQTGEGFEYHLLALALALTSAIGGGGKASVDRALMRWSPLGDRATVA